MKVKLIIHFCIVTTSIVVRHLGDEPKARDVIL